MAREKWNNQVAFLFTTVGAAVGLGNLWRFPYLCYKNGGGAFLIPYFVTLFLFSLPQLILQISLGQFTSRSAIKAWDIVPVMKGLGISVTVAAFIIEIPYATIIAWSLRYLYASFSKVLPWTNCGNSWNSEQCYSMNKNGEVVLNNSVVNWTVANAYNATNATSSVKEFWERNVLNISSGLTNTGEIQTDLVACLVVTWLISFLCVYRGPNWTSKFTYVTASLPIIILFALLIRGLTLDGASTGIRYFLSINMQKILQPHVWKDAALQNLYSLSLGCGAMIALGSFNRYHHNFYRDSLILAGVNSAASLLSGFAVFSTLGFMAKQQNTTVDEVAESGPGLVFIVYPQAVAMMPAPQLWSVLSFLMFFLLGLDTLFVTIETLIASISDVFPLFFNNQMKKTCLNLALTLSVLLLGLPTITQGGMYYLYLLDNFSSASWSLLFGLSCECIAIAWIYGNEKYFNEICKMLQYKIAFPWFKYCWKYIIPPVTMMLFVYTLALYKPLVHDKKYFYPGWAEAIGWLITLSMFLWIPGYAIYYLMKRKLCKTKVPEDLEKGSFIMK